MFGGLVSDWQALDKWDLNTEEGRQYLFDAFGEDYLLETVNCWAPLCAQSRVQSEFVYQSFPDLLNRMISRKNMF